MHHRIEIVRHPMSLQTGRPNPLRRYVWTFVYLEGFGLVLNHYTRETKDSTRRRKWTVAEGYDRLSTGRPYHDYTAVKESEVPWPNDVREEALQKLMSQIKVVRWRADLGR